MAKTVPFIQQEAALTILRAADLIGQQATAALKPFDLTGPQFNVLRILRGSPEGLPCGQIAERMLQHDPDITRLLARMEARGWILRKRGLVDKRVVNAKICEKGLRLLERVDPLVHQTHLTQFANYSESDMRRLIELLTELTVSNPGCGS